MSGRLAGKITLVTGGGSQPGLGSATGRRFAEEGAVVYLTDRDEPSLLATAKDIEDAGGRVIAMTHDVSREAEWDAVFSRIEAEHARLDALVNNAGIFVPGVMGEQTGEDFRRQIDVNLHSVFYGMSRGIGLMRETGGSIINISSIAGRVGVPGCGAYSAAKGGLVTMSKCAAVEHAPANIRINSIQPGMIMTNMMAASVTDNADYYEQVTSAIPMKRFGEPSDIANMALFLASDDSVYVTGTEFVVDGGYSAQ